MGYGCIVQARTTFSSTGTNFAVEQIKRCTRKNAYRILVLSSLQYLLALVVLVADGIDSRQAKEPLDLFEANCSRKICFEAAQSAFSFIVAENLILCAHSVGSVATNFCSNGVAKDANSTIYWHSMQLSSFQQPETRIRNRSWTLHDQKKKPKFSRKRIERKRSMNERNLFGTGKNVK